jgi:hypothetical protein
VSQFRGYKMRILNLEFNNTIYPTLTEVDNPKLIRSILKELKIRLESDQLTRGVIVHELVEKANIVSEIVAAKPIPELKSIDAYATVLDYYSEGRKEREREQKEREERLNRILLLPFLLVYIIIKYSIFGIKKFALSLSANNIEVIDNPIALPQVATPELILPEVEPPEMINQVSLYPENQDYPGYIMFITAEYANIRSTQINLYTDDMSVAITNQTPYVVKPKRKDDNHITGNLIIVHCSEKEPINFEYYASTLDTYKQTEHVVSNGTIQLIPGDVVTEEKVTFKCQVNQALPTNMAFLNYLIDTQDNDMKSVYEILTDSELSTMYSESFRLHVKTSNYVDLPYSSGSVI